LGLYNAILGSTIGGGLRRIFRIAEGPGAASLATELEASFDIYRDEFLFPLHNGWPWSVRIGAGATVAEVTGVGVENVQITGGESNSLVVVTGWFPDTAVEHWLILGRVVSAQTTGAVIRLDTRGAPTAMTTVPPRTNAGSRANVTDFGTIMLKVPATVSHGLMLPLHAVLGRAGTVFAVTDAVNTAMGGTFVGFVRPATNEELLG